MPVLEVFNIKGDKVDTIEVNEEIFGIEPNKTVLHEVLVAELAGARQGTASTKTRGMVRGGGRKPFRQKGTGRARQGSTRAPHFVGGGVTFGPKPRSFEKKVNKKVRKLAIRSALSEKVLENSVIILDGYNLDVPRTKTIVEFTAKIGMVKKPLFVVNDLTNDSDWNTYLSARNMKDTEILMPNELCVYWLLKQEKVIITREALKTIEEVLV